MTMSKSEPKVALREMFEEYARKEIEFVKQSDPDKLYHRILPNIKDKDRASIDFLYKKIKVSGFIDKDTIYLNKLKVTEEGKEEDIEAVLGKIQEVVDKGDMKLVNQL